MGALAEEGSGGGMLEGRERAGEEGEEEEEEGWERGGRLVEEEEEEGAEDTTMLWLSSVEWAAGYESDSRVEAVSDVPWAGAVRALLERLVSRLGSIQGGGSVLAPPVTAGAV